MNPDKIPEDKETLDFDKEWDYSNPEKTEKVFRKYLDETKESEEYVLQLKTQLARTLGLQRKFEESHKVLNEIEGDIDKHPLAKVRYLLERGRTYRSSGEKEKSRPLFLEAYELSSNYGYDFYTIDAAHMLGIVEPHEKQIKWNELAIKLAKSTNSERASNWIGSLSNNLGWTYHDMKNFDRALELFKDALKFRESQGKQENILIAKWCIGRVKRSMNRIDEALEIQENLLKINSEIGREGGYTHEELGELYLIQNQTDKSKQHFAKAYQILSQDQWLVNNEQERLQRIKSLSE